MIRFILLQNRAGKTRLAKYYIPLEESEKHGLEHDVHRLISTRDPKYTNFVEVRRVPAGYTLEYSDLYNTAPAAGANHLAAACSRCRF